MIKDKLYTEDVQFAYKNNFSTTMCSFLVIETIQYYKSMGSNVYVSLLDYSKAFDMVKYKKLFDLLLSRKICPLVVRLLFNIYINT